MIGNQSDHDRDKDFWPIPVDCKGKKFDIEGGVKSQLLPVSLTPKRQSPEHAGRPFFHLSSYSHPFSLFPLAAGLPNIPNLRPH